MSRVIQCFLGVNMIQGHDGLSKLAKGKGIDVKSLEPGNFVVFINNRKDRIKVYTANNVIAYLRMDSGKIDLRTISEIPRPFNASGKIDYDKALKDALLKAFERKKRRPSVLEIGKAVA